MKLSFLLIGISGLILVASCQAPLLSNQSAVLISNAGAAQTCTFSVNPVAG